MEEQSGNEDQTETQKKPGEERQLARDNRVVNLSVEGQQRCAVKEEQREAEEKQNAFKVALAAVPENHRHPEKRQQGTGGENDKLDIEHHESNFSGGATG